MVTIDPNQPILNITELNQTESRSKIQKGEFEALFRQAVDSTEIKGAKAESTRCISEIRPARFSTEPLPSADMVVDQARKFRFLDDFGDEFGHLIVSHEL